MVKALDTLFFKLLTLCLWVPALGIAQSADEVTTGEFRLHAASGAVDLALLQHSRFDVRVHGMVARVVVQQTFAKSSSEWVEGEYVFPLSNDSAVDYMAMRIGERFIVGQIREKEQARRDYDAAKSAGKKASLVSQQRPNLFSNRVANIAPGETVMVELRYVETLHYDQGRFSLRLPTTITPRYIPGQAFRHQPTALDEIAVGGNGWATATDQVPDAQLITPPMVASDDAATLELTAQIDGGLPMADVESLHHAASVSESNGVYSLSLDPGAKLNRDVVLRWTPQTGRAPVAAVFRERVNDNDYLLLMLMPPQQSTDEFALPREVIYVVDTSGSMSGVSIAQAREALLNGIGRLAADDRLNVVEFNSAYRALWPTAVGVNPSNRRRAEDFIRGLDAGGGTEMASALGFALTGSAPPGFVRQVIFVTDRAVGNESALFAMIENQLGDSRLFTVGIGSSPNSHFMEKAAQAGRGSFTYIGSQADVAESMSELFYKLEQPLITDIRWDFGAPDVEVFPAQAPDLYAGEPLVLTARWPGDAAEDVTISGQAANGRFAQSMGLQRGSQAASISKLWARNKLDALYRIRPVTAEIGELTKQGIIDLALEHQLMSRHTSFIAIEDKVSRPPQWMLHTRLVPNAMPEGNTMALPGRDPVSPAKPAQDRRLLAETATAVRQAVAVPLPRGALGVREMWLIASLAVLCLLLLIVTRTGQRLDPA